MLYEIDACLTAAMQLDEIKVVIISADGPHFSSGHDLGDRSSFFARSRYLRPSLVISTTGS